MFHIQYMFLLTTNLFYIVLLKKSNLSPQFYRAQLPLTKLILININQTQDESYTWKKLSRCRDA